MDIVAITLTNNMMVDQSISQLMRRSIPYISY